MGGAGKRHHIAVGVFAIRGQLLLNDFGHRHQRFFLYAFGHIHDQLPIRDMRCRLAGGGTHKNRGHRKQQHITVAADFFNIRGIVHIGRQAHAGQVGVGMGHAHGFQFIGQGAPHGNVTAVSCQHACQRGSPGSGTQNTDFGFGHRICSPIVYGIRYAFKLHLKSAPCG